MKNKLFLSMLAALLCGCGPYYEQNKQFRAASPSAKAVLASKVHRDDFKKITSVRSIEVVFGRSVRGPDSYWLEAQKADDEAAPIFLFVFRSDYGTRGPALWRELFDRRGQKFSIESSSLEEGFETCSVTLPREYVTQLSQRAGEMKIYGERAEKEFHTDPIWIAGFLQKCDAVFNPITASK